MQKNGKRFLAILAFAIALSISLGAFALTAADIKEVAPIGHTTGIKMFTSGIMVIGITEIETESGKISPAKLAGLQVGDIILKLNGATVTSNEEFRKDIAANRDKLMSIDVSRKGVPAALAITPVKTMDGDYRIGAWIRDSMAGIGTITFYDPVNKIFGALGHGICDADTGELIPFGSGSVMESTVSDVKKGTAGKPGELRGSYNLAEDYGILKGNTDCGIFGTVSDDSAFKGTDVVPIATYSEIKTGEAFILCNIAGDKVEKYSVEIMKIFPYQKNETKNLMLKVTDARLIEKTGGIVQGMSGSPILQNGKLIGAVTHVLVNDPQKGYGITIDKMISTAFDSIYKDAA
ncbi:MAG: SpoIVB peptidase [Clostridia bacterium]